MWALLNSLKSRGSTSSSAAGGKLPPSAVASASSGALKAAERRRAAADAVCAALDKASADADADLLYAKAFSAPAAVAYVGEMCGEKTDFQAMRKAADDAQAAVTVAAAALERAEGAAARTNAELMKVEA